MKADRSPISPIGSNTVTSIKDARNVLADLAPLRREVRGRSGHWYDMRLRPYRTVENKIDGVVITFLDISELRSGEARQRLLLSELTHRVRNILAVIQAIARHTLRADQTNKELIDRFEGRLAALASAHTLLVESDGRAPISANWRSSSLPLTGRNRRIGCGSKASRFYCRPIWPLRSGSFCMN